MILISCSVYIDVGRPHKSDRKAFHNKRDMRKRNGNCKEACSIYEYDTGFKTLIGEYMHPWCICMSKCMENADYCEHVFGGKLNDDKSDEEIIDNK